MVTYIYALIDPRTNEVRYVGKSNTPEKRLIAHVCTTHVDSNPHKLNWIKQLKEEGLRPVLDIVEETTLDLWPDREKHWIAHYRALGNNLTNLADGGLGGGSPSEETKRLIGEKTSTRMKDQTIKAHLRDIFGRKIVRSDGKEFGSIKIAADELGIQHHTVRKYIENEEEIDGFKYYWVNVAPKHTRTGNNSKIKCVETGQEYGSILEAATLLRTNRQVVRESLKFGRHIKGLHYEYVDKSKVNPKTKKTQFKCVETGEIAGIEQLIILSGTSSRNVHRSVSRGYTIRGLHYEKLP